MQRPGRSRNVLPGTSAPVEALHERTPASRRVSGSGSAVLARPVPPVRPWCGGPEALVRPRGHAAARRLVGHVCMHVCMIEGEMDLKLVAQFGRFGMLAAVLAFVFGMTPTVGALAQDDTDDLFDEIFAEATDGAGRSFSYEGEDTDLPATVFFMVAEFEDEAAAEEAYDAYGAAIETELAGEESGGAEATPAVEFEQVEEYDVADGGAAYRVLAEDSGFAFSMDFIVVRDATDLHVWFSIGFSMEEGVEPADSFAVLNPLVEDWFADGSRAGEDILDRVPTADDLPDGYMMEDEFEGLDELMEDGDDAVEDDEEATPAA